MEVVKGSDILKKVITYGTFDILHGGHISLLKRAREMGDYLVVGISTDKFNTLKEKQAYYSFDQRKAILEAVKYVDKVIPEDSWEQKADDIKEYDIDLLVMGDNWTGVFDDLKSECDVTYIPRTPNISSTKIKEDLLSRED